VYAPELKMPPSEYFKRQGSRPSNAMKRRSSTSSITWVMTGGFSTDFPHGDSKFPGGEPS